jgi:ribosomal protein S18 acetylase RimI-like enzyme
VSDRGGRPGNRLRSFAVKAPAVIRIATADDAPPLAEVAVAAYSGYLPRLPDGVRPAPLDADYRVAIAEHEVWIAEGDDGRVAGFVVLVRHPDHLLLENLAVHPSGQGQGIGHALSRLAEERAAAYGLTTIRLYTHAVMTENQRLYARWGYVETERRQDGTLERVFYAKQL